VSDGVGAASVLACAARVLVIVSIGPEDTDFPNHKISKSSKSSKPSGAWRDPARRIQVIQN
jgi:hypothetical protein